LSRRRIVVALGAGLLFEACALAQATPASPTTTSGPQTTIVPTAPTVTAPPGAAPSQPLPAAPNAQVDLGPTAGSAAAQTSGPLPLPPPAADPRKRPPSKPGALTLQQAVDLAQAKNPTLLAARQNLFGIKAQEIQAGLRVNPYLAVAGQDITLPASGASNPYAYSVQLSRLFERGEKRRWRLDIAHSNTDQSAAQLHDLERSTTLAVKQAFTTMLVAKAALELSRANLEQFRHEVDINNERYKAGDIGKLDFERLDLQLAQFESDQSSAEVSLGQASDQLQTLIGYERPSTDPSSPFDIAGDIVPPAITAQLPELDQLALNRRPDYQAAQAAIRVADANTKLAYANGTTDPTLEGEYERSASDNTAGFNFSIPLRIFDRNQGNKETAKFQAQSARFSEIAAKNQVLSDVDQAWVAYTKSRALAARYSDHYLDEATDVLQIAQFAYEHGGIALIDYLDALRDSRSTTADALAAYAQTWQAIHQLSYVTASEVAP
jgi:cobalt-zinc-cadmium efflux system outer membrane protein